MAINPPSDLVLGAILAADPARYRAAATRLQRAGGAAGSEATPPAATSGTSPAQPASNPPAPSSDAPKLLTSPAQSAASAPARKTPDAFAQLEAFVLQSFIQTMLPDNSRAFFGKGTAGEVWKSMLAEKLGDQLARSKQVGLAKRLAVGRSEAVKSALTPAASGGAAVSPSLLSALPYLQGALSTKATGRS